jgi:hypothetical protein
MKPLICPPPCGAALGNQSNDGATLQAGGLTLYRDTPVRCSACGRETIWIASPPRTRDQRRTRKHRPPTPLVVEGIERRELAAA